MANVGGFITEAIWRDQEWRRLSRGAQALYVQLLTQKELDAAGMLPLLPNKWAKGCDDLTVEQVMADLDELQGARFVLYDEDTDEAFVRTYVRNANVTKVPNMRKSAKRCALLVASPRLRMLLAAELLATGLPDLVEVAAELNPSITPAANPLPNPLTNPLRNPLANGSGEGEGVGEGHLSSYLGGESNPTRPQCPKHDENSDEACRACMRRREWDEKHAVTVEADELERKRSVRAAIAQARSACRECDDDGWLLGDDGTAAEPATKCSHGQAVGHA